MRNRFKILTALTTAHPVKFILRSRVFWIAILLSGLMLVPDTRNAQAGAQASSFCSKTVAHNYLKALQQMMKIRRFPNSERLPFIPADLSNFHWSYPLVVGRQGIVFQLISNRIGERKYRLDWTVVTQLHRVNRKGVPLKRVEEKRRHFDIVRGSDELTFFFSNPAEPAFYRFDVIFRRDGKTLGRFSEYFRVVRPHLNVRLSANARAFAPGQTVYFRLENLGPSPILFGEPYAVEMHDGANWVETQIGPEAFFGVGLEMAGGFIDGCTDFLIPVDTAPGRYRISKAMRKRIPYGKPFTVTAEFDVVKPSS